MVVVRVVGVVVVQVGSSGGVGGSGLFSKKINFRRFNKLLNYRDDDEKTPLHLAVQEGRSSRVEILLQHDAGKVSP